MSKTALASVFDGASDPKPVEPDKKEDAKASETPPVKEKAASSSKEEKKEPPKKEEPPKQDKKSDDPPPKKDEKKEGGEEEKKKEKPSVDWETEDNPFVKRHRDTAAYANKEHQENLTLKQQVAALSQQLTVAKKKEDGTYDPEKDDPEKQVKPEDVAAASLNIGKTLASRNAANREHGKEKVDAALAEFTDLFEGNAVVQAVVLGSESPVSEAMNILERYHFEKKYGNTPTAMYEAIKKEVLAAEESEMKKRITQEIMDGLDKKGRTPSGLSSSRGSSGVEKDKAPKPGGVTSLKEVFS